jgi:hypothetical protein
MTSPTAGPSWAEVDVEDLSTVFDHIDAMLAARTTVRRLLVLASAEERRLGGERMVCHAHPASGEMSFRELRRHCVKYDHTEGDVEAVPTEHRELGRDDRGDDR